MTGHQMLVDEDEVDYNPTAEEAAAACAARDRYAVEARARIAALPEPERRHLEESRARHLAEFEREQALAADPRWNHQ